MNKLILFPYKCPDKFYPYLGDNFIRVPDVDHIKLGEVRITDYVGKELSEQLWEDLVYRLEVKYMMIYGPFGEEECTIGRMGRYVRIYLHNNYLIRSISLNLN